jgi:hypothetical protein
VKLPANCPHRRSAKNWRPNFSGEENTNPCCRNGRASEFDVFLPKKGPLCRSMEHTVEVYRFTWRSSFDGDAVVQIGRGGKNITLDWACSSFTYGNGRFWNCIEEVSWHRLEDALLAAGFWCLDPIGERYGLDGATWAIEGRRRDVYRAVERWSPHDAIYDLGRTFFDLAGPLIADIRLY